MAKPFDRAGFIGQIVAVRLRAQDGFAQHADAEHLLRRLRLPEAVARFGAGDTAVGLRRNALQRIGDRQRNDAANRVVLQRADQRTDQRRGDARARGIVNQHPVVVVGAESGQRL